MIDLLNRIKPAASLPPRTPAQRIAFTRGRTAVATPAELPAHAVPAGAGIAVQVRNVGRRFGHGPAAVTALDNLSFEVAAGEFVCIVGASGCGKSTLLNLVAGLDQPTSGSVQAAGGQPALLFQDAALFPWLTVAENIAFPMRMQGIPRRSRKDEVAELVRMVRLQGFEDRRPHELSGGMRQRAALARALAQRAGVLLMDEPFGAVDAITRELLHGELERVWRDTGVTILFVTHDVGEAVRLADRLLVLTSRPGRIAAELAVSDERPRRQGDPRLAALAAEVTALLRDPAAEVLRR